MKNQRKLGIWMDHANAHLMEFTTDAMEAKTVGLKSTGDATGQDERKGESQVHNKEQQQESAYYKELEKEIANYDHVLLFGPTDAKLELFNLLKADRHFESIKIDVLQADKMTEHQQFAFVKEHFKR